MIQNKKAVMGSALSISKRFIIVAFMAAVLLGFSVFFYAHHIDIRDAEARLMARQIMECLSPQGTTDPWIFDEEDEETLFEYCNTGGTSPERFFVRIKALEEEQAIATIEQGDSGALWIKDIFKQVNFETSQEFKKYEPGYFKHSYPVRLDNGKQGQLELEVLVRNIA